MQEPPFTERERAVEDEARRLFGADGRVRLRRWWLANSGPGDRPSLMGYKVTKDMPPDQRVTGYEEEVIGAAPDPTDNKVIFCTPEQALADAIKRNGRPYEGVVA
jgi:hypothetical protein